MAQTTLSLLSRSLGLGGFAIGALAAGANLIGALTMLLITAHLATSSARRAIFVGLVFMSASLGSFLIPSQAALVAGVVFLGIAGGLTTSSLATAMGGRARATHAPDDVHQARVARARALATLGLVLSISLALGPLYESLVLSAAHERLRVAYLAFVPVALIGAVAAYQRGRPAAPPTAAPDSFRTSMTALGSLFRNRTWSLAVCSQAIYMIPFAVVVVFAGLLGRTLYHTSASTTEIGIALFFTASFLCRATLTRHPAVAHRITLFGLCVLATLCGIALLACGAHLSLFMLALAILGVPHGLTYPLAIALVADSVPTADLSRANAAFQAVSNLINVVIPLGLGAVIDRFGDRDMLLCAVVLVAPLAVLLWRLRDAN